MRPNFNIVEEDAEDFWDKYEEFIQHWNEGKLKVKEIQENLGIPVSKYRQYRERALNENRLDIDIRSPRNSVKRGHHTRTQFTSKRGSEI